MACSKLEARGHLLHKTGTPPKHFSRECSKGTLTVPLTPILCNAVFFLKSWNPRNAGPFVQVFFSFWVCWVTFGIICQLIILHFLDYRLVGVVPCTENIPEDYVTMHARNHAWFYNGHFNESETGQIGNLGWSHEVQIKCKCMHTLISLINVEVGINVEGVQNLPNH